MCLSPDCGTHISICRYSNKILIAQKEKSVLSPADAASRARFLRSMGMCVHVYAYIVACMKYTHAHTHEHEHTHTHTHEHTHTHTHTHTGMGPQCFDHGLRHGQTDDIVSVIERRYVPATAPVLQVLAQTHFSDCDMCLSSDCDILVSHLTLAYVAYAPLRERDGANMILHTTAGQHYPRRRR